MFLFTTTFCCCSASMSCLTLQPHGLSHVRIPCLYYLPGLLKFVTIELVMSSKHLILSWPLLLFSIFPSISIFSKELAPHIKWPKYWSFSFSISPFNDYSGLISFRIDWFDLLAVQRTLKSLLQHHSSKTSILQCSAFFMVQLSHLYITTGKPLLQLWRPLSAKWCLWFVIHCLVLS